jgi:acetyl esterase/lipase
MSTDPPATVGGVRAPGPAYPPEMARLTSTRGGSFEVVSYGPGPEQFGELWPGRPTRRNPVIILLHGGYWRTRYRLDLMHALAADLQARGFAIWNIEYRRIGMPGAGWPGTFQDVANAIDALADLSRPFRLELHQVLVAGHSAGGHLALWAASRHKLGDAKLGRPHVRLSLAVSLAGITDLAEASRRELSDNAVDALLGGGPETRAEVYGHACPSRLLPTGIPKLIVHGTADASVPYDLGATFAAAAAAAGDACSFLSLPGVGHFELIDPETLAWQRIISRVRDLPPE